MTQTLAQHAPLIWAAVGVLTVGILVFIAVGGRRRARSASNVASAETEQACSAVPADVSPSSAPVLDSAALAAAVSAAEANGHKEELPALYLSIARCRLEVGETDEAETFLRKSILGAGKEQQKEVHAQARLALGDLAHAGGDLTTACEHWQIARALFHELKQGREHDAAEARMLRNGCPTDWVLNDF